MKLPVCRGHIHPTSLVILSAARELPKGGRATPPRVATGAALPWRLCLWIHGSSQSSQSLGMSPNFSATNAT
jgi:hypothetical protein